MPPLNLAPNKCQQRPFGALRMQVNLLATWTSPRTDLAGGPYSTLQTSQLVGRALAASQQTHSRSRPFVPQASVPSPSPLTRNMTGWIRR